MTRLRLGGGSGHLVLDAIVLLWAVAWICAGAVVSHEMRGLAELSDTAAQTGRAAIAVGETAGGLPLIGGEARAAADEVRKAGEEAVASAATARANARHVGDLIGTAVAVIPSLFVLLLYVPLRVAATRERRELKELLEIGSREEVDQLLALRAVARLPLHRLRAISDNPARDLGDGLHHRLADAELRLHGLSRPRARGGRR